MKNLKTVFYRKAAEVDNVAAKWSLYYTLALILAVLVFLSPLLVFMNIKTTLAGEVLQYHSIVFHKNLTHIFQGFYRSSGEA